MSGDLKVTAGHVRELGEKQGAIAAGIAGGKAVAQGASWDVGVSHGLICFATSQAVLAANLARDAACDAMRGNSEQLQERLGVAALHYDNTDAEAKSGLDGTMGS